MRRLALALAAAACLAAPAPAAAGVEATCALSLSKSEPATLNVAFPDEAASYWSVAFAAAPGMRLRIAGELPHARYMSFNSYDPAGRPLDVLTDVEIEPEPGHVNPFAAGADRTADHRSYVAHVDFGPRPADPAPNTLYAGGGQGGAPNPVGLVIYRVYIADDGLPPDGGVGVPQVVLEPAAGGGEPLVRCPERARPELEQLGAANEALAGSSGAPAADAAPVPGYDPPQWAKFVNLPTSLAGFFLGNAHTDSLRRTVQERTAAGAGGSGGFLSNLDNAYVATVTNRAFGRVLETHVRVPETPDTRGGAAVMEPGELRYLSLCTNEFFSQRFWDCAADDETALGADRTATYVVSAPADRPANARPECGVTWLRWGPAAEGVLILRHMLPDPAFAGSIQAASFGREPETMGANFPVSRYYADAAEYEAKGCPAA